MKRTSQNTSSTLKRFWLAFSLILIGMLSFTPNSVTAQTNPPPGPSGPEIQGPFVGEVGAATEVNTDLRTLPQANLASIPKPAIEVENRYAPGQEPKNPSQSIANWVDPVAQTTAEQGLMPSPSKNFDGMNFNTNGSGIPPDPNGDVGPNYYIQMVNTSYAIYNKTTGALVTSSTLNSFFFGHTNTPCGTLQNNGDPVVVYDRFAQRWLMTDLSLPSGGPYYECIALSKTSDPVSGGWYLWGVQISATAINDYPKLGVWRDGYYFSFNMFTQPGDIWNGVQVWAFDKASMLASNPTLRYVTFSLAANTNYGNLLPAHALSLPPSGAPELFGSVSVPNQLQLWKFAANWVTPSASTFTGPTISSVANFATAASVPQMNSSDLLDSLSFRPMMQLIYQAPSGAGALWMNQTVTSGGVAALRWYQIGNPIGTPTIVQQGTYQPDNNHRWTGSLAVDQDGNMAIGYSISSPSMNPSIRYTGRLAGEMLGLLPQSEWTFTVQNGSSSQTGYSRWGDYSAMALDPDDSCTFWYTNEYYNSANNSSGYNWQTSIIAFKYPSCGQPKGTIKGVVRDSISSTPISSVKVAATSSGQNMTVATDASGAYTMTLMGGTYNLVAGSVPPGYPNSKTVSNVVVTAGNNTTQNISLDPTPNLVVGAATIDDNVGTANGNGYAEPGESGIKLFSSLLNNGAAASSGITSKLSSPTAGVTISAAQSTYPNINPTQSQVNSTPFVFSLANNFSCGADIQFQETVTDSVKTYHLNFLVNASVPGLRTDVLSNNVESGVAGWTTGGSPNTWAITTLQSHSPTHSWTDSPNGDYANNTNSWLNTPGFSLGGMRHTQVSFWTKYALEPGFDFVYLDYSTDGGATFSRDSQALATLNGISNGWEHFVLDTPNLDNQWNVVLRFRIVSDSGVTFDGVYLDDISVSYVPYSCAFGMQPRAYFPLLIR